MEGRWREVEGSGGSNTRLARQHRVAITGAMCHLPLFFLRCHPDGRWVDSGEAETTDCMTVCGVGGGGACVW